MWVLKSTQNPSSHELRSCPFRLRLRGPTRSGSLLPEDCTSSPELRLHSGSSGPADPRSVCFRPGDLFRGPFRVTEASLHAPRVSLMTPWEVVLGPSGAESWR